MSEEIIAEGVRLCLEKNLPPEKIDLSSILDNMSEDTLHTFAQRGFAIVVEKALNERLAKKGACHPAEGRNPGRRWEHLTGRRWEN